MVSSSPRDVHLHHHIRHPHIFASLLEGLLAYDETHSSCVSLTPGWNGVLFTCVRYLLSISWA